MKFFSIVAPLLFFAGLAAAIELDSDLLDDLTKRACAPSDCVCNGISGLFCGTGTINPDCQKGHVYQCSPSTDSCDFGIRDSCMQCNKLVC